MDDSYKHSKSLLTSFILTMLAILMSMCVDIYDFFTTYTQIQIGNDESMVISFLEIDLLSLINNLIMFSFIIGLLISMKILKNKTFDFKALGLLIGSMFLLPGIHGFFISPYYTHEFTLFWTTIGVGLAFSLAGLVLFIIILKRKCNMHKQLIAVEVIHILHIVFVFSGIIETLLDMAINQVFLPQDIVVIAINLIYLISSYFMFRCLKLYKKELK